MISSTILTLIVIPAIYAQVKDARRSVGRIVSASNRNSTSRVNLASHAGIGTARWR